MLAINVFLEVLEEDGHNVSFLNAKEVTAHLMDIGEVQFLADFGCMFAHSFGVAVDAWIW